MKKLSFFSFLLVTFFSFSQEICNNAIDDDGDGLIDLNDPDCSCSSNGNDPLPYSYVVNESFELNDNCPTGYGQMSSATNWGQATAGSTDYLNDCGFVGPIINTNLYPFPTGQGATSINITSDYKEYIGTCLSTPLVPGTSYTLKFYIGMTLLTADGSANTSSPLTNYADSLDIVIYGATTCGNLPLNTFDCPTAVSAAFNILGSRNISVDTNGYQFVTITFVPTSLISEILIGTDCIMPSPWPTSLDVFNSNTAPYFVLDQLIINETTAFEAVDITSTGSRCTNDLVLTANHTNLVGGSGQWYQNGVALLFETNDNLGISASNYGGGIYTYLYTTGTDCFRDTMSVDGPNNLYVTGMDTSICLGEQANISVFSNAVTFNWTAHSTIQSTNNAQALVQPNATTVYELEGISAQGCSQIAYITVTVNPIPTGVSISSSPAEIEDLGTFTAAPATYTYQWTLPDGDLVDSSIAVYNFESLNGIYTLFLRATNTFGCVNEWTYQVEIDVVEEKECFVPNAFSPDGNEFNPYFLPILPPDADIFDFHFWVYDRKGNVIFESLDPKIGWDGTYNNKTLASDIYTWKLVVGFQENGEVIDERGHVFLAR